MPKENSPVAAMLMEHDQGRSFVRAMETAVLEAQAGRTDTFQAIADNALGYPQVFAIVVMFNRIWYYWFHERQVRLITRREVKHTL